MRNSCGHKDLAAEEVKVLLPDLTLEYIGDNFFSVNADFTDLFHLVHCSGSLRLLVKELFAVGRAYEQLLYQKVATYNFSEYTGSYVVRVHKIGRQDTEWSSQEMEQKLGGIIHRAAPHLSVNLKDPDITFSLIVYSKELIFSELIKEQRAVALNWKSPNKLPYFRGGAIKPIIARLMANLYHPMKGEVVVDPFCGHGGILLELAEMGYYAVGIELDPKIARQGQANLRSINFDGRVSMIIGDALKLPFRAHSTSYMVTDPPYAIQTTTSGKDVGNLVEAWLSSIKELTYISFATPNDVLLELPPRWVVVKSVEDYVHRHLSRHMRLIFNG